MGTGNKVVDALARGGYLDAGEPLYLTPHTWYKHILLPSGRPDFLACLLLAEIMYWYRPVERRHEATGRPIGWRKKFRADKLQKSYSALAEQLNVTKRQVRDAMTRLDEAGLITREFRNLPAYDGLVMTNVLFVEPVLERVLAITYRDDATSEELDDALDAALDDTAEDTLESDTSDAEMYEVIHYDVPPHTPRMHTYTETSPEISSKRTTTTPPPTPPIRGAPDGVNASADPLTAQFYQGLKRLGVLVASDAQAEAYNEIIEDVRSLQRPEEFVDELIREAAKSTAGRITPRWFDAVVSRCARDGVRPGAPRAPGREARAQQPVKSAADTDWDAVQREYGQGL